MLRNKNVTLTFLLSKDVSFMIRIINDTSRFSILNEPFFIPAVECSGVNNH